MTAPDLQRVVEEAIAGETEYPVNEHIAHQARAVLAALTEAGAVQFGVRWHVGGCGGINRCTSKRHAERQAAKLIESGHEAAVVSRLTLPWTAVQ